MQNGQRCERNPAAQNLRSHSGFPKQARTLQTRSQRWIMKSKTTTINGVKLRNLEQLSPAQQAELEQALTESEPVFTTQIPDSNPEISLTQLRQTIDNEVTQRRMGALLEQARLQANLSGRATAKRLSMNHVRLRKLEASDTNLEVGSFVRVAHELEFDVTIRLEKRNSGLVLETKL
jgi:hypothetical protein